MKRQHVINCSFSSWYQNFKHVTIASKVVPLPKDFVEYLKADGIYLPSDNTDEDEFDGGETEVVIMPSSLERVKQKVDDAIRLLGGQVFPKLNWSSPKDASWIAAGHSLKCCTLNDIILLLKTSDFVTHDLTMPFSKCKDDKSSEGYSFQLILRKWIDINPSMEFRVFVRNNKIRGISQRDYSNYFTDIPNLAHQLRSEIMEFYQEKIRGQFADKSYVFDLYRQSEGDFLLLDFNPYGEVTDPLLFTWNELEDDSPEDLPEFRCVESSSGIQPSPYLSYGYPKDIDDIATGENLGKLIEFLKMERLRQQGEEDDDSDDT